jgi:hypothetical protein
VGGRKRQYDVGVFNIPMGNGLGMCVNLVLSDKPINIVSGFGTRFYAWAEPAKEEGEAD